MRLVSFPFHSDTIGAQTKDQSVSSDRSSNGPENLSEAVNSQRINDLAREAGLPMSWLDTGKASAWPELERFARLVLADVAEAPQGWRLVPEQADEAMLRPFYECPPEELTLAWNAMLFMVAAKQRRSAVTPDNASPIPNKQEGTSS